MGHEMTGIRIDYKRDMQNSYLVIGTEIPCANRYQLFMLLNNQIEGILPIELRSVDDKNEYYYRISSMQTFSGIYEKRKLNRKDLKTIVRDIILIINRGKEYLLIEDGFLLLPDYIFLSLPDCRISLCYLPGYHVGMAEQISSFLEILMNKVDYKDEEAVLLVYGLYMASKEEGCTFDSLLELMQERKDVASGEDSWGNEESAVKRSKITEIETEKEKQEEKKNGKESEHGIFRTETDRKSAESGRREGTAFDNPFLRTPPNERMKRISAGGALLLIGAGIFIWGMRSGVLYRFPDSPDLSRIIIFAVILIIFLGSAGRLLFTAFYQKKMVIKPLVFDEEGNRKELIQEGYSEGSRQNQKLEWKQTADSEILSCFVKQREIPDEPEAADWPVKEDSQSDPDDKESYEAAEDLEGSTILLADFYKQDYYLVPAGCHTDEKTLLDEFPFFIGKWKEHVNLIIDDCSVSRFHAKIVKEGEEYFITDLNSTNGTFLNRTRLEPNGSRKLTPGDEIAFAGRKYEFVSI